MPRPNVLLVYPDQMRYDCTSSAGDPTVRTPGFDRLARSGVNFTRAYTSFPLCCPFRASLMTGTYAHINGMYTNHYPIPLDQIFLPRLMGQAGYHTGWFGKWHLNGGNKFDFVPKEYQLGFHEFVGYSRGHNYLHGVYYRNDDPQPYRSESYEPEYQTNHVIDFMDRALQTGAPFLGMICYGLPHTPLDSAPDHYRKMYPADAVQLPDTIVPEDLAKEKTYRAKYYGLITCVDDQLRRLTDWLERKGILEDTVLIFVSDHGDMNGEHGLHYKSSFHEAAMHVPLVIHYPRLTAHGRDVPQLVDPSVDLMPTILDLCGVEIPSSVQGHSLRAAMVDGQDASLPDHVYYQLIKVSEEACAVLDVQECKRYPERGLRTKDFLYVEKCGAPFALYDVGKDPGEKYNRVNDAAYVDTVELMRSRLYAAMVEKRDDWAVEVSAPPVGYQNHAEGESFYRETYARAKLEA